MTFIRTFAKTFHRNLSRSEDGTLIILGRFGHVLVTACAESIEVTLDGTHTGRV
jgi:hypothetical protein